MEYKEMLRTDSLGAYLKQIPFLLTGNQQKQPLKLLITGAARSGTQYSAFLFQELGFDVPHESLGADGSSSWLLAVDADSYPWGCPVARPKFDIIFHQVRDPLKSIGSLHTLSLESWSFIGNYVPIIPEESILRKSALYWIHWNKFAEQLATVRYRVEDMALVLPELCDIVGVEYMEAKTVKTSTHARRHPEISWEMLDVLGGGISEAVHELSVRYGYYNKESSGVDRLNFY